MKGYDINIGKLFMQSQTPGAYLNATQIHHSQSSKAWHYLPHTFESTENFDVHVMYMYVRTCTRNTYSLNMPESRDIFERE